MSTVLFLNTKKEIPKNIIKKRKITLDEVKQIVEIHQVKNHAELNGYHYFFDNMWIPFYSSLSYYQQEKKLYSSLKRYIVWIIKKIKLLDKKGYNPRLFLYSIENDSWEFNVIKELSLLDFNETTVLEYKTLYEFTKD